MTAHSDVSSNAFNFPGFVTSAVDPRTGQYTVSVDLPELKGNHLSGPDLPLALNFNPLNLLDSGFGLGWNLRLSQFVPGADMLSLYSGESYKITGSGSDNELAIKERKLFNFRFFRDASDSYRIVHINGTVEVLKTFGASDRRVALPVHIHGPLGHRLDLEYDSYDGHQCLKGVRDQNGELLRIVRSNDTVKLLRPPFDVPQENAVVMRLTNRRVVAIVLPTDDQASWRFSYAEVLGKVCVTEVQTPLGGREIIEYRDTGHPFPGNSGRANLPRVTRHQLFPGFDQPMMDIEYEYTPGNFLGYGTSIPWHDDGLDQLYNVTHTYHYGSTTRYRVDGAMVREVERTYNRFHLLVEERTQQNQCVKHIVTTYHASNANFDQQPPWFQLPKTVETRWEQADDSTRLRVELTHSTFDEYGNLVAETREDGSQRRYSYYAAAGEEGCPEDPDGFVRHLKESRLIPAPGPYDDAPEIVNQYRYVALQPLPGTPNKACLLRSEETDFAQRGEQREALNLSRIDYFETPANALLHGRRKQLREYLEAGINTTDFHYASSRHALLAEDSLHTVETLTTFDQQQQSLTWHESLEHGEVLLSDDANGVEVLCRFDRNRRTTHEVVAPGTDVEATREYSYTLTSLQGQQAMQTVRDVKGVLTRTRFDGIGRTVAMEHWNGSDWLPIYSARHDALGQLVEETRIDWFAGERQALTSQYTYDDWGEVCRTIHPDRVVEVNDNTPFGQGGDLRRTWLENADDPSQSGLLTVTQFNPFDKPDWIERHDDQGNVVGRQVFHYDGYGHCTRQDEELESVTLSTWFEYDTRGRVQRTRLPDATVVERGFASHSIAELTTSLRVIPGDLDEPSVLVGEQRFDGLERLNQRSVGPRVEEYLYQGSRTLVRERITPSRQHIEYDYDPNLSEQASAIRAPGNHAWYTHDRHDASLGSVGNAEGTREYEYDAVGHLQVERWVDNARQPHETHYETSLLGQPQWVEHDGVATHYHYDPLGRVECMTQGQLQADFEFDALGRAWRTTTRDLDSGDTLISENLYDSLGRIELRSLWFNDQPARTIKHVWRADDQLLERHQCMDGRSLLLENYRYDARGRLEHYTCSGERLPCDRYGNAITSQLFLIDALDNIRRCVTGFANGQQNVARYTYADDDPCQLREVTNSYTAGGYPGRQSFAYDDDGNQLNDELGQQLRYDSLGRLLEVTSPDGNRSLAGYRYDGHQHLLASRLGDDEEVLRFYHGFDLAYTVQGTTQTLYFGHDGIPLGQQQLDDHERTMLLLTDASPSVIGESLKAGMREAVYSVYGEIQDEQRLQSLMAFNGESREEASGWYLLGRGYRAYNPSLMRFHSPDSLSPFHEGGINPYMYCLGNPVRFHDPSGHRYTRRPGTDPIYTDPIEPPKKPKKSWLNWLPVILMAVTTIALIAVIPIAAPVGVGLVMAIAGAGIAVAGTGLAVWGTLTDNETLITVGGLLVAAGSMISGIGNARARSSYRKAWQAKNPQLDVKNAPSPSLYKVAGRALGEKIGGLFARNGRPAGTPTSASIRGSRDSLLTPDAPNATAAPAQTAAPMAGSGPAPSAASAGPAPAAQAQVPAPGSPGSLTLRTATFWDGPKMWLTRYNGPGGKNMTKILQKPTFFPNR
ncbi:RHS repeat domain-containing protein [Pseudomonas japonica]|uniref:RHS repeat-associated core domain-containing protein n=1 Tax=Pseudomonas japonica TaxID=256466 RepID=A0A239GTH3_9PSED|nr:RHS repeat-associated core domain-containing protein [Pseudomonas japonica]SNS71813.1 RHS repeat-associated core domain-containing protein [Pseudomonas japonica]